VFFSCISVLFVLKSLWKEVVLMINKTQVNEFEHLMMLDDLEAEKVLQANIAWEIKAQNSAKFQQTEALLDQVDFHGDVEAGLKSYLNHDYLPHLLTTMTLELRKMDADQLVANNENLQNRLKKLNDFSVIDASNLHWAHEISDFSANKLKNFNL